MTTPPRRIDTHTHVVPPFYLDWLRQQPGYRGALIEWNPDAALEAYDRLGVETGILSVSSPGVRFGSRADTASSRTLARRVNEYCAEVVRANPRNFGFFATLTLPDVDGAVAEAAHALDDLDADGVVLLGNVDGTYLGAPEWDPLMDALDQRGAVVFVHPTALPGPGAEGISPGVVDFLADTARAAVNVVRNDMFNRYPNLTLILAHGGGFVPYAANRIASMLSREVDEDAVLRELRKFHFDTALTGGPYALPSLLAFADPGHLLFGSDWPYEFRPRQATDFTTRLDECLPAGAPAQAIARGNAERLFPRLADDHPRPHRSHP